MTYKILTGNNLDILPTLADNSIDSIVTDPPYGLSNVTPEKINETLAKWLSGERDFIPEGKGFMGKAWDSFVPPPAIWDECLRVLKPGGHLLAFFGSRTMDIGSLSIRLAGFEIRDAVAWLYGSGFPKSLDISKAIDKRGGQTVGWFGEWLKDWRKANNITQKQVAELFPSKTGNLTGCVANWELGLNIPTAEQFTTICRRFDLPFASLAEAEREVIGTKLSGIANKDEKERHTIGASQAIEVDITAPSTPEAQQWQGWGTALKPAFEPVIVARKPITTTVAENVLTYGTGGLNIDGSRIGTEQRTNQPTSANANRVAMGQHWNPEATATTAQGRWPANVILDEHTAGLLDEQSDASRFFYVAKASKRDRNEGLDELPTKGKIFNGKSSNSAGLAEGSVEDRFTNSPAQNFHPTVKPTDLMRYLVKLVTPPNGTVLDPFTGSGSTGKAAILEGFDFIGIEMTEEYLPILEGRLKNAEAKYQEAQETKGLF